jgi:putative ABC transport system permease protein
VGIIKDFHFTSLHSPLEPLVLEYYLPWTNYLLVKVQGDSFQDVLTYMEEKFDEINPGNLFRYSLVDEVFDRNYREETRALELFKAFSILALFVSCLGMFGLTVYSAEVRIKEIAIRKVLGASGPSIILLLSKEFVLWVLLANILAWPTAFLAMNKWLANFAYHVHIHVWTFINSAALAALFAIITVSYQAVRATVPNPADNLRYQ